MVKKQLLLQHKARPDAFTVGVLVPPSLWTDTSRG
jgi:hypothetical protein